MLDSRRAAGSRAPAVQHHEYSGTLSTI